jgi:Immunoglobulin I-set domain
MALAATARADFNPVILTSDSFNQDIVVERGAPGPIGRATNASMDSGTNNNQDSWYEEGFNLAAPPTGLPPAGSVFTSASLATHQYQMAPDYTARNAMLIDASVREGTWALTSPADYASLSFLTSGGHNGLTNIGVLIHHQDGSIERGSFGSPDWFNGASPAYTANGRVDVQTFGFDSVNSGNPRLYSRDISLTNSASPVTSIDFTNQSVTGGDVGIFAVSGAAPGDGNWLPVSVAGYNADMIVEASAPQPVLLSGFTTATMDTGLVDAGNTWFEAGYDPFFPSAGLPAAGASFTSANQPDHHYTMPPSYAANDAAVLDGSYLPSATLTPATPTRFSALAFLGAAANGATTLSCAVQHQDLSTENFSLTLPDWVSSSPVTYYVNGRLTLDTCAITNENVSPQEVRLYEPQIALANTVSPVTSISLAWAGGSADSRAAIFAISGTEGSVPPIIDFPSQSVRTYEGPAEVFSANVTGGTPPFTYQWQKGTNGVFVNLDDGANISGSQSTTLTLASVGLTDSADYRLVVSNAVGAVDSGIASLMVLSSLPDVTAPGDPITSFGSPLASPPAEVVTHAIDDDTSKFLSFGNGTTPYSGTIGLVVTPASGSSRVTVLRLYTANDSPERDPADYILEGSNDGGSTYNLMASGPLALPNDRNAAGNALDPLSQPLQQVSFNNLFAYTTYRLTFPHVKNASLANSCQIGEVELLGVNVALDISVSPTFLNVFSGPGASAQFSGSVSPVDPSTVYQWEKQINGVWVPLTDDAWISGSTTATLTVQNVQFADEANYLLMVSNATAVAASQPVFLNVLSQLSDVTAPGDAISNFGPAGPSPANEGVTNAIDNTTSKFLSYPNGATGPVPFVGPVGLVVSPAAGRSIVTGLRIYTANDNPVRDPADYQLEGSNDGGASYSLIAAGALTLPNDRNSLALPTDPVSQPNQEVRFTNTQSYATYKLTIHDVKNNAMATSMQFAELELLGTTAVTLNLVRNIDGSFTLTSSAPGELWSTPSLAAPLWQDEGPISGAVTIFPSPASPSKFYRVSVP